MNEVFRPPRKRLYEALACSVLFALIAIAAPLIVLANERREPLPPGGVWFIIAAIEAFWLAWLAVALYGLAAYWRMELRVEGRRVHVRGVFRTATFDLATVTQARWRHWPSARLKLFANGQRLKIDFDFDGSPRLMEYFHQQIPLAMQVDWPRFHHRYLVPRGVGPDDVLVDRKRIDRYLFLAIFLCWAVLLVCGIWVGFQKAATGGCVASLFLFGLRYLVPKKGFHEKSMQAKFHEQPEFFWFIGWQLLFAIVVFIYAKLERSLNLVLPGWAKTTGVTILGVAYVVNFVWFARCDYLHSRKRKAEIEAAWTAEHDPIRK